MQETIEYEYFEACRSDYSNTIKTQVYELVSSSSGRVLGKVRWKREWRQYCFYPKEKTVFSKGCLNDVNDLIARLEAHREERLQQERDE